VLQEGLQNLVEKETIHKLPASESRYNHNICQRDNHCNTVKGFMGVW